MVPTIDQRQLGAELRNLRKQAGLSGKALGAILGSGSMTRTWSGADPLRMPPLSSSSVAAISRRMGSFSFTNSRVTMGVATFTPPMGGVKV